MPPVEYVAVGRLKKGKDDYVEPGKPVSVTSLFGKATDEAKEAFTQLVDTNRIAEKPSSGDDDSDIEAEEAAAEIIDNAEKQAAQIIENANKAAEAGKAENKTAKQK